MLDPCSSFHGLFSVSFPVQSYSLHVRWGSDHIPDRLFGTSRWQTFLSTRQGYKWPFYFSADIHLGISYPNDSSNALYIYATGLVIRGWKRGAVYFCAFVHRRCGLSLVSSANETQSGHMSSTCQSRNSAPISSCVALRHGSTVVSFLAWEPDTLRVFLHCFAKYSVACFLLYLVQKAFGGRRGREPAGWGSSVKCAAILPYASGRKFSSVSLESSVSIYIVHLWLFSCSVVLSVSD